ncbi:MAG: GHKL domain-containing protein [Defluviitaleaceae bacterium]|nr:GHKL domain-containing protein [Defluviitaleaceae bacterium]
MGIFSWLLTPIIDRRIAQFQNGLMATHIAEVEHIYNQMRGWRHDYHNHMQKLKAHLHLKQYGDIDTYLTALADDLAQVDVIIKTGNVTVDAILNSKVSVARAKGINVNAKAIVPTKLNVAEIDLCVIIGNLLDNAVEACLRLTDPARRFIRVYIDILKGQLYISVSNARAGEVKRSGVSFLSTKEETGHGFGLMRIDRLADKYGGFVNRQAEEGVFATEVMLPL